MQDQIIEQESLATQADKDVAFGCEAQTRKSERLMVLVLWYTFEKRPLSVV